MAENIKKEILSIDELRGEFNSFSFIHKDEQYTGDRPFGDQPLHFSCFKLSTLNLKLFTLYSLLFTFAF